VARLLRKVIHISAHDSPNVALGLMQQAEGKEPTGESVIEGVLSWDEYTKRMTLWDPVMVTVGVHGEFWQGKSSLLYPPEWLNESARHALQLIFRERREGTESEHCRRGGAPFIRTAKAAGCDPGEGGDPLRLGTAWTVVDEHGVLEQLEARTTDTSEIGKTVKFLIRKWRLDPHKFVLDRGGGGKQISDQLRSEGYPVRTVGFGEPPTPDPGYRTPGVKERVDQKEDRYAYPSRRCQIYHELRLAIDPSLTERPFAIPFSRYPKLRKEMARIPLKYDGKGRVSLPEKHRSGKRQAGQEQTLTEIIGWSPDLLDSLALAYYALGRGEPGRPRAGALRDKDPEAAYR
jgi:hypothetical protein